MYVSNSNLDPKLFNLNYSQNIPFLLIISYIFSVSAFLSRGHMDRRQLTSFPCGNCGKVYNYHSSLVRHLRHECGVEPKYICHLCPYKTKHRSSLNTHIIGKHKDEAMMSKMKMKKKFVTN